MLRNSTEVSTVTAFTSATAELSGEGNEKEREGKLLLNFFFYASKSAVFKQRVTASVGYSVETSVTKKYIFLISHYLN